jgi:hypothetical protein
MIWMAESNSADYHPYHMLSVALQRQTSQLYSTLSLPRPIYYSSNILIYLQTSKIIMGTPVFMAGKTSCIDGTCF